MKPPSINLPKECLSCQKPINMEGYIGPPDPDYVTCMSCWGTLEYVHEYSPYWRKSSLKITSSPTLKR